MVLLEKEIETALRTAIRTSINTFAETVSELQDAKIVGDWLAPEDGETNDYSGMRVELSAQPNSSDGYIPGSGFQPFRTCGLIVTCVSQPDSDDDNTICNALYEATRTVFETAPLLFTFPASIQFGGMLITSGGSLTVEGEGKIRQFNVEFKVNLI
jgi:hypothetical protein